jgi:hypothetical protein
MEQDLQNCQRTMQQNSVPELSGAAKNTLYTQYKAAWEAYQRGMPSHEQLWRPNAQNLHIYMRHAEANRERGQFLQNVHRILDPTDDLFSLDMLRPDKSTPFNGAAYREGYEQVQFQSAQELAMQLRELDDTTYLAFLQYRAQGITSQKLYEEKLGIHRHQYDACLARLAQSPAGVAEGSAEPAQTGRETSVPGRRPVAQKKWAKGEMTAKAQQYLETYGDVLMTLGDEEPLTETSAAKFLHQVEPDKFPKEQHARNTARVVLNALVKTGRITQQGKAFVVSAAVVE